MRLGSAFLAWAFVLHDNSGLKKRGVPVGVPSSGLSSDKNMT